MFTVKFYSHDGYRQVIEEAESFTVLRTEDGSEAEITLHRKDGSRDARRDIAAPEKERRDGWPPVFEKAIIENALGRTTEIISWRPLPSDARAPKLAA